MRNIFRQFAEWDTHLSQNEFQRAVVLLTLKYTVGVLVILTIFNLMVYGLFANSTYPTNNENLEQSLTQESDNQLRENEIEAIQGNLVRILLISDAVILFLTLIAAYVLSKRTLAPLEKTYQKQVRFVADAAHELRTPLAVMQAGSEVILRSNRTVEEYTKFIHESLEEVKRLTTLSNNLLFLARNKKKTDSLTGQVNFSEAISKQVEVMRPYGDIRKIVIQDSIASNLFVQGSKDDLTRLVINLLKNAIDYNQPEGKVTVSLTRSKDKILLSVADTGVGIKPEALPHIFERFYKADSARTQNSSGTGLGLAIVKEIVDEHRGSITVSSTPGKGSIFKVSFPGG